MAILKAAGLTYRSIRHILPAAHADSGGRSRRRLCSLISPDAEALGLNALEGLRLVDLDESQPAALTELPAIDPHAQTLGLIHVISPTLYIRPALPATPRA